MAEAWERPPVVSWDRLVEDAGDRHALCETLRAFGFAVVVVPPAVQQAVAEVQALAAEFFELPAAERRALGSLRLFKSKVIGYRELGGGSARFLELHALSGGRVMPPPKTPIALRRVAARLHADMQGMARSLITWLAEDIGVPPAALLQCLDEGDLSNLDGADCGASVLRLASYGYEAEDVDGDVVGEDRPEAPADEGGGVYFDEHTDASFVTLAPVCPVPGLQFRNPRTGAWLDAEHGLAADGSHFVVFAGDFVEVLTRSAYCAASHRVVKTGEAGHRLSMPFLARGQPDSRISTSAFLPHAEADDEAAGAIPLLRIDDMRYAELRQFLDLKGRRRFAGTQLLSSGPSAEQASVHA